jgi:tRNA modification GTPase
VLAGLDPNDTIAAIATPSGPALRSIVRLSGPRAVAIALEKFVPPRDPNGLARFGEGDPCGAAVVAAAIREGEPPCDPKASAARREPRPPRVTKPRSAKALAYPRVLAGRMRLEGLRPYLPVQLALWSAPGSYTGQDVAEIHLVGSAPLVNLLLASCLQSGARHAQPGEFTLRAFLCGRIDLTRAEAVLGVIDAHNPAQLDAALQQLAGGLSGPIAAMRDQLLDLVAHLEANLDFTEEPDVDVLGRTRLVEELEHFAAELESLIQRLSGRDRPAGMPQVVLAGPPNVGKSQLFNALLGRHLAIVSPEAGTTRDYLTGVCDCDGIQVELIDTAGIEHGHNAVAEQAQVLRALQAERADIVLECRCAELERTGSPFPERAAATLMVWTKADVRAPVSSFPVVADRIVTSAATGQGLDELRAAIADRVRAQRHEGDLPAGTAARCRGSIMSAQSALQSASRALQSGGGDELAAFDLRQALDELGKVVGAVVTDDILDRIFRRFCIGK